MNKLFINGGSLLTGDHPFAANSTHKSTGMQFAEKENNLALFKDVLPAMKMSAG